MSALLEVRDLRVSFRTRDGVVRAVDGVSTSVERGQTLGVVGESGSGKSVTALTVMGLTRLPNASVSGEVLFDGDDLLQLSGDRLPAVRGRRIAMIFQDPLSALNPVQRVGTQIVEMIQSHQDLNEKQAMRRAIELLELVGLGHRINHQPTKMSGGEQQRTAIARSLISSPTLVLADEPTANLDHRTGETVVRMLRDLCSTLGVTVVASTHDPTVADEASRVVRMKDGQIVN